MGKEDRKKVVLLPNIVRIFLPPNPLQIVSTRDRRQQVIRNAAKSSHHRPSKSSKGPLLCKPFPHRRLLYPNKQQKKRKPLIPFPERLIFSVVVLAFGVRAAKQ